MLLIIFQDHPDKIVHRMKPVTTFSLLFPLALLSACTTPQVDISPQTTTPTSIQTSASAKMGRVIQITEYLISADGEKSVTLNGKKLLLNWRVKNDYNYDTNDRLIRQRTSARNNPSWWEELSYQYTPDLIQRYQNSESKDLLNTLLLNTKGYLNGNLGPDEYVYDADGYLISYTANNQRDTYTIKNGNVIAKETVYSSGLIQKNTYEYDRTKPGIPSPLTFRGQQSQNLLLKQTMVSTSTNSSSPETTVFTHQYDFDQQGRAIREFVVSDIDPNWPTSIRESVYQ
jgi:hypothetical protein